MSGRTPTVTAGLVMAVLCAYTKRSRYRVVRWGESLTAGKVGSEDDHERDTICCQLPPAGRPSRIRVPSAMIGDEMAKCTLAPAVTVAGVAVSVEAGSPYDSVRSIPAAESA